MTCACMLAFENYSAQGIAETDTQAVTIPIKLFDQLAGESTSFRHFVFAACSKRIAELFQIIEDVAFQRLDIRLAEKLLELDQGAETLHITHQKLAIELGTAREVISHQLSEYQRRHWVKLSRGAIEVVDGCALKNWLLPDIKCCG